jgi:hypothetical protein
VDRRPSGESRLPSEQTARDRYERVYHCGACCSGNNAFEMLASPLHAQPVWPTHRGANVTTSSESIPLFPKRLSGFISEAGQDFWGKPFPSRGTMRIFQGQSWQGIPDFPNTQNGCSSGAFMIRWRSANPDVRVQSSARYSSEISEKLVRSAICRALIANNPCSSLGVLSTKTRQPSLISITS